MHHRFSSTKLYARAQRLLLLVATGSLISCSFLFQPADLVASLDFPWPQDTPVKTASRSQLDLIHEDPNRLAVLHGLSCAQSDRPGQEDFIRIQEDLDFSEILENDARWITDATVFLNGWRANFLNDKHEILGVSAALARIDHSRTDLSFEGGGALADEEFDAPYELCYNFTVLAWNRAALAFSADDGDSENVFTLLDEDNASVTSLNVLRNYRQGLSFVEANTPAGVLPRGFGMAWGGGSQMLQAAYSMGASANVLSSDRDYGTLPQPASLADDSLRQGAGGISWDSSLIFKPNDSRSDVYVAELVSIVGGDGMALLQPPFAIDPVDQQDDGCGGLFTGCIVDPGTNGPETRQIVVENLPFAYAVPVLTGWSLGYFKDDHTIRDLGATIDDFSYERPAGSETGTLRYSVTAVSDNFEDFLPALRHRVSILGFDPGAAP